MWLSGREKEREGGPAGKEGVVCMFASVCVYPREREVGGGGEREKGVRERESERGGEQEPCVLESVCMCVGE